jgi:archaellum biogenesis protein FlaJ (TadC family)
MRVSDLIHAPQYRIGITLTAAVVMFLLALIAGYAGVIALFFILWTVGSLLIGAAVWQTEWFWRIVHEMEPKTEDSRRAQGRTALVLAGIIAVLLIYVLAQPPQ